MTTINQYRHSRIKPVPKPNKKLTGSELLSFMQDTACLNLTLNEQCIRSGYLTEEGKADRKGFREALAQAPKAAEAPRHPEDVPRTDFETCTVAMKYDGEMHEAEVDYDFMAYYNLAEVGLNDIFNIDDFDPEMVESLSCTYE